ncbi:type II toxin-antitoxin system HigA family antitoxin [Thalassospira sp. HF15]|uniref:helix-turn-helix domain-containing protein n=1 Tax=Thalassospira sp. HF15 TaxID=2722755 RepID=UPI001C37A72D|nr:hypothetical protein [Thalassospira sp. HF15]
MQKPDTIKTEADYTAMMAKLEEFWDAKPGTPEADQLEVIGILIDQYEAQQLSIAATDAVEAVLFYMEQNGLERAELQATWQSFPRVRIPQS